MKAFLNRFLTKLFLLSLTVILLSQSTALAGPLGDKGGDGYDISPGRPSRAEAFAEAIKPSVANPEGTQPEPGQNIDSFFSERRNKEIDKATGGRDVNRNNAAGERMEKNRKEGKSDV
jgi:hypothetical protein